jgi:hypothetical protein
VQALPATLAALDDHTAKLLREVPEWRVAYLAPLPDAAEVVSDDLRERAKAARARNVVRPLAAGSGEGTRGQGADDDDC